MAIREESYGNVEITPHPPWAEDFWNSLVPLKDRIGQHPLFSQMSSGALPIERFRYMLLNFYPLVANFPHYMGLTLAKSYEAKVPGVLQTRDWLINNIKVEQRHLYWYRDWALGFGISTEALDNVVPPAAMDAVNHYLWHVNQRGSIAEGLAATNLAIEWATGDWTRMVVRGMKLYAERGEATIDRRSMAWLRAHAHYDDVHPYEAMELVKILCGDDKAIQARSLAAARRGMEYYLLALDHCYDQS
jgi:pyrroloquinoline quinone (PQQ) biosynthesis protein C